jgi:hypothetical protein
MEIFGLDPKQITITVDPDGMARWEATICNFDTKYQRVDVLVCLDKDVVTISTRPSDQPTLRWSPSVDMVRM